MRWFILFIFIKCITCELWPKGVIHFDINKKDYDLHSQDEIISIFGRIEKELCVKFFLTQKEWNSNRTNEKIMYISNPEKVKHCVFNSYDYDKQIVEMTIGYKCLNPKDIARMVVDMLRASIQNGNVARVLSDGYVTNSNGKLLSNHDRDYINEHYNKECNKLNFPSQLSPKTLRRMNAVPEGTLSPQNIQYYSAKIWPKGVVNYIINIDDGSHLEPQIKNLEAAMTAIESSTCILFNDISEDTNSTNITTESYISFEANTGEEIPAQGKLNQIQLLNVQNMTRGTPGHTAHILFYLMRILGFPMESNRVDRNNYIEVNWNNIEKGNEQFFELNSEEAMIHLPYDFESATHAPSNWMCGTICVTGAQTIHPIADNLWQRTLTLGRNNRLSETDINKINLIYSQECKKRNESPLPTSN